MDDLDILSLNAEILPDPPAGDSEGPKKPSRRPDAFQEGDPVAAFRPPSPADVPRPKPDAVRDVGAAARLEQEGESRGPASLAAQLPERVQRSLTSRVKSGIGWAGRRKVLAGSLALAALAAIQIAPGERVIGDARPGVLAPGMSGRDAYDAATEIVVATTQGSLDALAGDSNLERGRGVELATDIALRQLIGATRENPEMQVRFYEALIFHRLGRAERDVERRLRGERVSAERLMEPIARIAEAHALADISPLLWDMEQAGELRDEKGQPEQMPVSRDARLSPMLARAYRLEQRVHVRLGNDLAARQLAWMIDEEDRRALRGRTIDGRPFGATEALMILQRLQNAEALLPERGSRAYRDGAAEGLAAIRARVTESMLLPAHTPARRVR